MNSRGGSIIRSAVFLNTHILFLHENLGTWCSCMEKKICQPSFWMSPSKTSTQFEVHSYRWSFGRRRIVGLVRVWTRPPRAVVWVAEDDVKGPPPGPAFCFHWLTWLSIETPPAMQAESSAHEQRRSRLGFTGKNEQGFVFFPPLSLRNFSRRAAFLLRIQLAREWKNVPTTHH